MTTVRERFLGTAVGWRAFKGLIRSDEVMDRVVEEYIKPQPGDRILDIGCGYGDLASHLTDVRYVGVDSNEQYIAYAKKHAPDSSEFRSEDITGLADENWGKFDCVVALGVLHHLDDRAVERMLGAVAGMLNSEGRMLAMEPVWDPNQQTITRLLLALDRGRFVRDQVRYEEVFAPWFGKITSEVRHDMTWFPYSHCFVMAEM